MDLKEIVARNLYAYRVKADLTQDEVCRNTATTEDQINVRHYSQMELPEGKSKKAKPQNLTLETIAKLAKGLGIKPHLLLQESPVDFQSHATKEELAGLDSAIRLLKSYRSTAK